MVENVRKLETHNHHESKRAIRLLGTTKFIIITNPAMPKKNVQARDKKARNRNQKGILTQKEKEVTEGYRFIILFTLANGFMPKMCGIQYWIIEKSPKKMKRPKIKLEYFYFYFWIENLSILSHA